MAQAKEQLSKYLAKHKPGEGYPEDMPIANTLQLAGMWQELLPYYHDLGYVKDLTRKEVGELGHFRRATGVRAYRVMKYAIAHWPDFLYAVFEEQGIKLGAKYPVPGLLLKYWPVVLNLMDKGQVKTVKKVVGAKN